MIFPSTFAPDSLQKAALLAELFIVEKGSNRSVKHSLEKLGTYNLIWGLHSG